MPKKMGSMSDLPVATYAELFSNSKMENTGFWFQD
jgi:hypothetical protein